MSEDQPKVVDPESNAPVSEQLQARNHELGTEAVNLANINKELSEESLLAKASPLYWLERKHWKKETKKNENSREALNQEVAGYIGEIQEEANNYVSAYEEYAKAQAELGRITGAEVPQQRMNTFIAELDIVKGVLFRYDGNETADSDPSEKSELFKKQSRLLAVQDFFTPRLPVDRDQANRFGAKTSYLQADSEHKFKTYRGGQGDRVLRSDIGTDDELQALEQAHQTRSPAILELVLDCDDNYVSDGVKENLTVKKYIPLSEAAKILLNEFPGALDGSIMFFDPNALFAFSRMPSPRFTLNFGANVLDTAAYEEKLNQPQL